MVAQATEVDERVRAITFHGNDAEVAAEVARIAPADRQPVPGGGGSKGARRKTGTGANHLRNPKGKKVSKIKRRLHGRPCQTIRDAKYRNVEKKSDDYIVDPANKSWVLG